MFAFLQEGLFPYFSKWLHLETDGAVYALYFAFFLLIIVIAYLLGSINSAILISRVFYHTDIRTAGSKMPVPPICNASSACGRGSSPSSSI